MGYEAKEHFDDPYKKMMDAREAKKDHYKKDVDPYFSEPCDTCIHKNTTLNHPSNPCKNCIHYSE